MLQGNRPDPRIRRPYLAKLRATVEDVARHRQGRITFLAGDPGSGRSATLRALQEDLRRANPTPQIIAASFADGTYTPAHTNRQDLKQYLDLLGNLLAIPGAIEGAVISPIVGLIAQLLQTSASALDFAQDAIRVDPNLRTNPALLLKQTLRHAAEDGPIVCLIDQIDRGEAGFIADFLLISAIELITDRPLTIIATVDGPPSVRDHADDPTSLLFPAASLVRRGLADWLYLHPMTQDEVRTWLKDAQPQLVAHLHTITGGNPGWLTALWNELWRAEKVQPHPTTYQWQAAPGYELAALGTVHDILGQRIIELIPDPTPANIADTINILVQNGSNMPIAYG